MPLGNGIRGYINFKKKVGTHLGNALNRTGDTQDTLVDARYDFTDAGFDTRLLTEVGDIFTALADDDASVLGTHESTKGEDVTPGWGRGSRTLRRG